MTARRRALTRPSALPLQGENGGILDAPAAEIYDLLAATRWALRYGVDAAISVLRVDSIMCVLPPPPARPSPSRSSRALAALTAHR